MYRVIVLLSALLIGSITPFSGALAAEDEEAAAADAAVTIATVESIDQTTRAVTLRFPDESTTTFVAGDEVRNLAQVKKGDVVIIGYFDGLAIALEPKGAGVRERTEGVAVTRAEPGEEPGATVTETLELVATVQAVDEKSRTVTLKGPERTAIFKVSDDIDLSEISVGDEVVATYLQYFAVSVEPAPKVSGEVKLESKAVALGIGYEWGHGTLTMYDGSVHEFKVNGLSVLDIGVSDIKASGQVYKLTDPKDFGGTYVAGAAGAALVKGGSVMTLKNSKGVVMQLKSGQKGVRLTLAAEGIKIKLKE
ncbi:MAG: copper-binding protein [Gammaproteobacteria bacterium]|jgi:Cu/Ag efflux protein CusF|nr:copper-binding protein [Gammaproteobacteria bacterium]